MIVLYGAYRSRITRNIWLMEELGQPYRVSPVMQAYRLADPSAADAPLNTLSPEFLALSPQGAIPVLQDEDFVLTESLAINLYLAEKFGGSFAAANARERACMTQWSLYAATSVETPALEVMYAHSRGEAGTDAGRARIAAGRAALDRPFRVLDAHLAAHPYLVGDRMTVADINLAETVRYVQAEPGALAAYAALANWLAGLHARPAFQKMWALRAAEPV